MTFLDTVKSSLNNAVDTVTGVTQTIIEKNRANAQLNRLRAVMKNECEIINRAYIALGKNYYENKQNGYTEACPNEEELFEVIEKSKANIKRARERYRQVVESQSIELVTEYEIEDFEGNTVSYSKEDETESSFTQTAEDPVEKEAEEIVADVIEKAKKNAEAIADEADNNVEETTEVAENTEELF